MRATCDICMGSGELGADINRHRIEGVVWTVHDRCHKNFLKEQAQPLLEPKKKSIAEILRLKK